MTEKETDIGEGVALWLAERDFEVFHEVRGPATNKRCDLIGRTSTQIIAVEAKVSLGLDVIAQAYYWRSIASEAWVAVPLRRTNSGHSRTFQFAKELCTNHGIGILAVEAFFEGPPKVTVCLGAHETDCNIERWNHCLFQQQKHGPHGGSNSGGYVTEFSVTCSRLVTTVAMNPDITLKAALKITKHHYAQTASAVQALSGFLNMQGSDRPACLAALRIEGKGTKAKLYLNNPNDF